MTTARVERLPAWRALLELSIVARIPFAWSIRVEEAASAAATMRKSLMADGTMAA